MFKPCQMRATMVVYGTEDAEALALCDRCASHLAIAAPMMGRSVTIRALTEENQE